MQKILLILSVIVALALLLIFPEPSIYGASEGLLLWFHTVLPALLPYMILTNLFLSVCCRGKATGRHAVFALLGLVCGYPMGAKLCAELVRKRMITTAMGQFLLPVCNIAGPAFISSYVVATALQVREKRLLYCLCVYIPLLLYALLHLLAAPPTVIDSSDSPALCSASPASFDHCVMDAFTAITKLGGYIILFSILSELLLFLLPQEQLHAGLFLTGLLEITNGISRITDSTIQYSHQIILSLSFVSFGGFSCICQTASMIQGSGLSILKYFLSKTAIALMTALFSYILFG